MKYNPLQLTNTISQEYLLPKYKFIKLLLRQLNELIPRCSKGKIDDGQNITSITTKPRPIELKTDLVVTLFKVGCME
jgi:hypothetical protein